MIFSSPAKINRGFNVIKKRSDGFHDIETTFQFLDWGDEIDFNFNVSNSQVTCPEVEEKNNLAYKALHLLKSNFKIKNEVSIKINKNIPLGSGLGGGSSNAATVLLVLNKLWKLNLTNEILKDLGSSLGSDVPIFIEGEAREAKGKGEIFSKPFCREEVIFLILPNCNISTAKAFQEINPEDFKKSRYEESFNFFEKWARHNYKEVDDSFNWLNSIKKGYLTGTGSALYTTFNSFEEARKIMDNAPKINKCFITRSLNKSPLHKELSKIGV
jgi:4-diphosphocytidyl-2-C-methyl-D-erythritol kinase